MMFHLVEGLICGVLASVDVVTYRTVASGVCINHNSAKDFVEVISASSVAGIVDGIAGKDKFGSFDGW